MRAKPVGFRSEGDAEVYATVVTEPSDRLPLLDLRTRLVLWILGLVFVGLVYLGLNSTAV